MAAALLWEHSPDIAFVVLDTAGVITAWRGAAEALFGFSEEEISGSSIDVLFVEEDRVLGLPQLEREVAVSAHRSEDDRWHLREDGARIWVTGSLIAIQQHGQHVGFVKVMADRTNLRARIETSENRLHCSGEGPGARRLLRPIGTRDSQCARAHADRCWNHGEAGFGR
jgi:PAS domain S-box-containing protein